MIRSSSSKKGKRYGPECRCESKNDPALKKQAWNFSPKSDDQRCTFQTRQDIGKEQRTSFIYLHFDVS